MFLPSISSEEKADLLARCLCVLYTPEDEHFGIVPLEAMVAGKPVLACNSGGPVESIVDGVTGFLCAPDAEVISFPLVHFHELCMPNTTGNSEKTRRAISGVCVRHVKGQRRSWNSSTNGFPCAAARE